MHSVDTITLFVSTFSLNYDNLKILKLQLVHHTSSVIIVVIVSY